jgi:hypothetical protein
MGSDQNIGVFSDADYESCLQLTRLTWLEWLPVSEDGVTRYVALMPNADAAKAAARALNRHLSKGVAASAGAAPLFEAVLHRVEAVAPIAIPTEISPGLVHAAVREAIAATFLESTMRRGPA